MLLITCELCHYLHSTVTTPVHNIYIFPRPGICKKTCWCWQPRAGRRWAGERTRARDNVIFLLLPAAAAHQPLKVRLLPTTSFWFPCIKVWDLGIHFDFSILRKYFFRSLILPLIHLFNVPILARSVW